MAFAASSAADSCGCGGGEPPSTAMVGRTKVCDPPDMVDSDADRLRGGDALSACGLAASQLRRMGAVNTLVVLMIRADGFP